MIGRADHAVMNAWAVLAGVVALAAGVASARADVLAAIVPSGDDVRRSIAVGPSGQVWEPDGTGTWTRRAEGGVAADVRGAALAGNALVVGGKSVPLYRKESAGWIAMRLGERGRTTVGTGPRASIAIGKTIFVWNGATWKRVGRTLGNVGALWAASETKVVVATDTGVARYAAGGFTVVTGAPEVAAFGTGGPAPWATTTDGAAYEVTTRRVHRPTVAGEPMMVELVAVSAGTTWALGRTTTGIGLGRFHKGAWTEAIPPPIADDDAALAMAADASGALLVATRGGALHVLPDGGSWTAGTRAEALPAATPGPGPARGR